MRQSILPQKLTLFKQSNIYNRMHGCDKCYGFIHDSLLSPQHPIDELYRRQRIKRLARCVSEISEDLLKILPHIRQNEYEDIETYDRLRNGERKINPEQITGDDLKCIYHRCVRFYYIFLTRYKFLNHQLDTIITILQEHMILAKCYDRYYYEQWFAQKFIYLIQNIKQIHKEHQGSEQPQPINLERSGIHISLPTAPMNWYDLYD